MRDNHVARIIVNGSGKAHRVEHVARVEALFEAARQFKGLDHADDLDGHRRGNGVARGGIGVAEGDGLVALFGEGGVGRPGHAAGHVHLLGGGAVARLEGKGQASGIKDLAKAIFRLAASGHDELRIALGRNVRKGKRGFLPACSEGDNVIACLQRGGADAVLPCGQGDNLCRAGSAGLHHKVLRRDRIPLHEDPRLALVGKRSGKTVHRCLDVDADRSGELTVGGMLVGDLERLLPGSGELDGVPAVDGKIRYGGIVADAVVIGDRDIRLSDRIAHREVRRRDGRYNVGICRQRGRRHKRQRHGHSQNQCDGTFHTKHPFYTLDNPMVHSHTL